ncbi:hypothetical protein [Glycomyces tenuis]|uniref:hypothetical protein n=1 Tax=Glycomyces tenuis TaxID=58116 RepID=UPI00041ED7D5|nr:hypothetical protein [Glycomyces tenuis]
MPMRRLTATAAVMLVFGAGCSAENEGNPEAPAASASEEAVEPSPSMTAHEAVEQVFQLELEAPEGFVADDVERPALVVEDHATYGFALEGGHADSRLWVTTYLLPEGSEPADYNAEVALILPYDDERGNTLSHGKHLPTLVNGYEGVYRNANIGEEIKQQNHYLFAGRHLIQITCQWNFDFNEVYEGCFNLTRNFPYPAEWPITRPAA